MLLVNSCATVFQQADQQHLLGTFRYMARHAQWFSPHHLLFAAVVQTPFAKHFPTFALFTGLTFACSWLNGLNFKPVESMSADYKAKEAQGIIVSTVGCFWGRGVQQAGVVSLQHCIAAAHVDIKSTVWGLPAAEILPGQQPNSLVVVASS